jgi:hypothetical protein
MIDSITNVFDTTKPTDWIIKFGNGLLSLLFSGNWNGNHTIHEINYYFESEFKKTVSIWNLSSEQKSSMQKSLSQ